VKYFASFSFDARRGTLVCAGRPVPLTRKAATLLGCLIARAPACVSHDDILAAVWPKTHVHPDNIKVLIREIRLALADDPQEPAFIRTDTGRGYAFIATIADVAIPGAVRTEFDPVTLTRTDELAILGHYFELASAGAPQLVLLSGERGSGGTSLCEGFLARVSADGALVAYAQGFEASGAAEPFGVLHDVLLQLRDRYPDRVDPVLARHPGALPSSVPSGSRNAPWAVARAVRDLCHVLAGVAASVPVVLVIDDLQWCDRHTFDVFRALSRLRLQSARILCVLTHAMPPAGRLTAPLRDFLLEMRTSQSWAILTLPPLDSASIHRLATARFDASIAQAIAPAIRLTSGGHAGTIAALLQYLETGAGMGVAASYWARCNPVQLMTVLREGARDSFAWRIAHLDRADQAILESAAVSDLAFSSQDVRKAIGASTTDVAERLERLTEWGLIRRTPDDSVTRVTYQFWDPLHAEIVVRGAKEFDLLRAANTVLPPKSHSETA
jgi:DNA-binding winged helix-turn-helix (wHTH) protein